MASNGLSWDDFRVVKAIADARSLGKAADTLGINHSTVFRRLGQIEHRLDARLFKRNRAAYALTPRGEEMLRLAERMEADVASFEHGDGKPATKPFVTGTVPMETVLSYEGVAFLKAIVDGKLPQPPICATMGFHLIAASVGHATFEGLPEQRHYNPIGSVHGGFAATLLDSALGCAVHSTLKKGEAYTTLEFKVNLVRGLSKDTGLVRAEGAIVHRGRSIATSEATLKDAGGKLYAHASTTCMIFPAKA